MKQKYKITSIITAFICIVTIIYALPLTRHWFYYQLTDIIVPKSTPNKSLDKLNLNNFTLLDCRDIEEYKTSHIPNSTWIGNDKDFWNRLPLKNDKPFLIYCSIGYRSSMVGKKIIDSLNLEIFNLEYGIFNYNYNKKPLIDSLGQSTENVHPYSFFWKLFSY